MSEYLNGITYIVGPTGCGKTTYLETMKLAAWSNGWEVIGPIPAYDLLSRKLADTQANTVLLLDEYRPSEMTKSQRTALAQRINNSNFKRTPTN